jgi:hypothetical protein
VFIPEEREIEATSMAKFEETRCSGALGIPRRSLNCGLRDPGEIAYVDLVRKSKRKHVRELRWVEVRGEGAERDREEVGAYSEPAMLSFDRGGAAASGFEQPGGDMLGFWEGRVRAEEGINRRVWHGRGARIIPNRRL